MSSHQTLEAPLYRQIDQFPLPNATTSRYNKVSQEPAATAAYLNKALHAGLPMGCAHIGTSVAATG